MPAKIDMPAERWAYWLPFATIASKKLGSARTLFNPAGSPIQRYKIIHERVIARLLALRITWAAIAKYELDSPLITDDERDTIISAAVRRRQLQGNFSKDHLPRKRYGYGR